MKVILLENIRKIGSIGEIIDVKRGFARNYLIANKKALYASKDNIREVTLFPMNQNAQDLLMGAPSKATDKQLKDLGLKVLD